ncbi:MAG TPA: ABC transporter permease [Bacillales bacterium]|nr:ABC transporter permease [Bacillales bacterium]
MVALSSAVPVLVLALWQFLCAVGVFKPYLLPAPTVIVQTIIDLAEDGALWGHISITLFRVFAGFLLGVAVAVLFGLVAGLSKTGEVLFDPMFQAFRSIPSLAWVPLFILWFQIGETSKVLLIAVGVFFPVYLNIMSGIHGVDRKLVEVGKIYGLHPIERIRRIILPAAMPAFLTGLRGGLGLGWMFVVAAEIMGSSQGLGYLLVVGQNTYSPAVVMASIVLFAVLGKVTDALLKQIEKKTLHWQDGIQRG